MGKLMQNRAKEYLFVNELGLKVDFGTVSKNQRLSYLHFCLLQNLSSQFHPPKFSDFAIQ